MRVAALTMSYNEAVWAPIWARHYTGQVGAEHCYMIDHGSDDGSTAGLGINVERIERSSLDEDERAARVSARAAALLEHYDAVVHSDTDELVIADPLRYRDLRAFAANCLDDVVTAVGFDLQHVALEEGAFDPRRRIGEQRRWVRFSAAMCKPVFIRRAVRWIPGFHACDRLVTTGRLFLVHLRYADTELGVTRLQRTRALDFATAGTNLHQRVSDDAFRGMINSVAELPRVTVPFETERGPIADWVAATASARAKGEDWLSLSGNELWPLPSTFLSSI